MFFCPSRLLHDLRNYTLLLDISTLHTVPPVYTKHINNINIIMLSECIKKKNCKKLFLCQPYQNHVWKNFFTSGINFYEVLECSQFLWLSYGLRHSNRNITCKSWTDGYITVTSKLTVYWLRNMWSCLTLILKSVSLNSYGIFQPRGPNFLLSCTRAWKKHKPYNIFFSAFCNHIMCVMRSDCNTRMYIVWAAITDSQSIRPSLAQT